MRHLIIFLVFIFSGAASADDYYWGVSQNSVRSPDPASACSATLAAGGVYTFSKVEFESVIKYSCHGTRSGSSTVWLVTRVNRYGTGCPAGSTYDPATGLCNLPYADAGKVCEARSGADVFDKIYNTKGECVILPNADLPAQCQYLSGKGTRKMRVFVPFDDDGNPSKQKVDALGCEATMINTANCKMPVAKAVDGISIQHGGKYCSIDVSFTGKPTDPGNTTPYPVANTEDGKAGVCTDETTCVVPEQPTISENKPCNYMSDGQVVGCETTQFQGNPGDMNCGTVNGGAYQCTARPPSSTGSSVKTEIKTTPNSDGGTTVTKNDTHTEIKCTAPGSCTTTVTHTTNTTIKDQNGNTTSSGTTCTGSKCATSTNPDANGDGLGDCVKNCGEGEEEGEDAEFKGPEIGDAKTIEESTQAFMNSVKSSPLLTALSNISVPSGGSCHFASVQTYIAEIDFDSMCDIWADIAPLLAIALTAAWALLAVCVLMTA